MPTKPKRKPAAKKAPARAERASEAQLDKDAAKVVKLRDNQNKSWGDIADLTDIAPSRLRALYNRGGGSPSATKAPTKKGSAKPAAKGRTGKAKPAARGRGKRNPS